MNEKFMDEVMGFLNSYEEASKNEYIVKGDTTILLIGNMVEVLIDTDDLERVRDEKYTWKVHTDGKGKVYVSREKRIDGKRSVELLHRFIMNNPEGLVIDHLNHDTLDNRKSNLRAITHAENMQNRKGAARNSRSGIRGVTPHKKTGKWQAQVGVDGEVIYLGLYDDVKEAEKAVIAAREKYMPFAK